MSDLKNSNEDRAREFLTTREDWARKAVTAEAQRDALAKALNRADSYFQDIQAMTKTSEDCPQWGRPDFSLQMVSIRRCARKAELDAREALATLERPAPADGGKV